MKSSELIIGSKVWFNTDKTIAGNCCIGWIRNIKEESITVSTTRKGLIVINASEIYQQKNENSNKRGWGR